MGKPIKSAGKKFDGRMKLLGIIAIITVILLVAALLFMLILNAQKPQSPLPAAPLGKLPPLPDAPSVAKVEAEPVPQSPLPEVEAEPVPQEPVTKTEAPPQPQGPSGTITWYWQLYEINPQILGVSMGDKMPGYLYVALGISVVNQSTANVTVSNEQNQFKLNVDNRLYSSDLWKTAEAVISGLKFLVPTELAPGGSIGGYTVFMMPEQYRQVMPIWNLSVPEGVRVVRVDPRNPLVRNVTPSTAPPGPRVNLPDEE